MDIYTYLDQHQIAYTRHDHEAVFTCEQAQAVVGDVGGAETKNLFVKDKKGRHHLLVVVGYDKSVDLKALGEALGLPRLGLASAERLQRYLGVTPGSVTMLGVINDQENAVEVVVDRAVWEADALRCHPMINTSTLVIPRDHMARLFEITGHKLTVLDVPGREA